MEEDKEGGGAGGPRGGGVEGRFLWKVESGRWKGRRRDIARMLTLLEGRNIIRQRNK
jgi:hypothetical protein